MDADPQGLKDQDQIEQNQLHLIYYQVIHLKLQAGSAIVTVTEPNHGRSNGDTVRFRNVDGSPGGLAFTVFENSSGFSISSVTTDNYTFGAGSNCTRNRRRRRNVSNGRTSYINTIMAGFSYRGLVTQIRNYTEVDSNVLSDRSIREYYFKCAI